jgi:hypothetical protein
MYHAALLVGPRFIEGAGSGTGGTGAGAGSGSGFGGSGSGAEPGFGTTSGPPAAGPAPGCFVSSVTVLPATVP